MHILIIGGSGFIGRALSSDLLRDGHAVSWHSRNPAATRQHAMRGITVIDRFDDAVEINAVVNLAGENLAAGRWSDARKRAFRDSRIATTNALVTWMAASPRKPSVLISGSAIGYYGPRGDEVLDENSSPGDDFSARLCRDWEAEAIKAQALGIRVCRLRTGIVLAPDGGALAKMLTPFRLGLGGPMGDGRQWMSWISRDDLVSMIRWLIDRESASGAFNGTAPNPVSNAEFARSLGQALHRPALLRTPAFALKLLLGEMADLLLTGQRVLPKKSLASGFHFRHAQLSEALAYMLKR